MSKTGVLFTVALGLVVILTSPEMTAVLPRLSSPVALTRCGYIAPTTTDAWTSRTSYSYSGGRSLWACTEAVV